MIVLLCCVSNKYINIEVRFDNNVSWPKVLSEGGRFDNMNTTE